MSRYTGPRVRMLRALGVDLPGLTRKKMEERTNPPGQHGAARKKESEYGKRLREKQKLRYNYGLSEKQLRNLMAEAMRAKGSPGSTLLSYLERRLDSVVFRAGFAPTIPAARQLVRHGHVSVGARRLDIPSYRVRRGDVIAVLEHARANAMVVDTLANPPLERPSWLQLETNVPSVNVVQLPDETAVPFPVDVQLIIEYYSKRM